MREQAPAQFCRYRKPGPNDLTEDLRRSIRRVGIFPPRLSSADSFPPGNKKDADLLQILAFQGNRYWRSAAASESQTVEPDRGQEAEELRAGSGSATVSLWGVKTFCLLGQPSPQSGPSISPSSVMERWPKWLKIR